MLKSVSYQKLLFHKLVAAVWLQSGPSSCKTTDSNPIGLFRWLFAACCLLPHHSHSVTVADIVEISVSGTAMVGIPTVDRVGILTVASVVVSVIVTVDRVGILTVASVVVSVILTVDRVGILSRK